MKDLPKAAYGTSTPGFMTPAGSSVFFAEATALPNRSGRCARREGYFSNRLSIRSCVADLALNSRAGGIGRQAQIPHRT
jgi:hypothetical protein